MTKLLKYITCEMCGEPINESKRFRCYEYNAMIICRECYKERINHDKGGKSNKQAK